MLRILHVVGRLLRGGAELRTVELAESFKSEHVRSDFLVLSGEDGPLDQRVRRAGGEVIKGPLGAGFGPRLYSLLRRRQYDVVHSHVHYFSGVILAVARLAGTPSRIAHFRTSVVDDRSGTLVRRGQLAICRRLLEAVATDVLAVGEGAMQGAWGPRWHDDPRCRVIYSGLPAERLQRVEVRVPDAPVIINVGSLQPLKNQVRLIGVLRACLQTVPTLRLRLVGREVLDYGWQVRRAAAEAGIADRVELIGEVDDPLPLIARSNLMIVPSLWEGLPGAALESCALGIPVLASDLPGARELARHFPHLSTLPLSESDSVWADRALRMIRRGPTRATDAESCLARSPFTLARAREAYLAIWSRNRASA